MNTSLLETFPNPKSDRNYVIEHFFPEFTSNCPKTGQPDFGEITIRYTPEATCLELKGLKFYLNAYRNEGIFYEAITNQILDHLVEACAPRWMEVVTDWNPRGGFRSRITASHGTR